MEKQPGLNTDSNEFVINPETGKIISHGHEYIDSFHIRELIKKANEIRAGLPSIKEGYTRLWRGNRNGEVGKNPSYTNSLEGIALPFLGSYGGVLSYIDIPDTDLEKYLQTGAVAEGSEFRLPPELVETVKIVGMSEEEGEQLKKESKTEEKLDQGNGWGYVS